MRVFHAVNYKELMTIMKQIVIPQFTKKKISPNIANYAESDGNLVLTPKARIPPPGVTYESRLSITARQAIKREPVTVDDLCFQITPLFSSFIGYIRHFKARVCNK